MGRKEGLRLGLGSGDRRKAEGEEHGRRGQASEDRKAGIRIPVLGPLRSVFQKEEMQRPRQRLVIVGVKRTSWFCLIVLFLVENSQQRSHRKASLLETEARISVFLFWGPGGTSLTPIPKPGN